MTRKSKEPSTSGTEETEPTGTSKEAEVNPNKQDDVSTTAPTNLLYNQRNKYKSFRIRAVSTVILIGSFVGIIYLGHVLLMFMIFGIQFMMVRELYKLALVSQKGKRPASLRSQQWYFFWVTAFWIYLRFVKNNLLVEITSNQELANFGWMRLAFSWVLRRHTILSYSLYTAGFVSFVLGLEKSSYLYQFGQYAWTHMILLVVFIPSSFFVSNIFQGLIWFLLPCSLVIINDIAAYLSGFFFGRTPLIALSPKKTWEGFAGGLLLTILASWHLSYYMSQYKWMTCPREDLSLGWLNCDPDSVFKPQRFTWADLVEVLPDGLVDPVSHQISALYSRLDTAYFSGALQPLADFSFVALPIQVHAVVLAAFASVIAPFGGLFASGFKRGLKIKDFGDSIPGHGGMTDRMDCQVVMAAFAYVYYNNFVAPGIENVTVASILGLTLQLSKHDKLEFFRKLASELVLDGIVPTDIGQSLGV